MQGGFDMILTQTVQLINNRIFQATIFSLIKTKFLELLTIMKGCSGSHSMVSKHMPYLSFKSNGITQKTKNLLPHTVV